MLRNLIWAAVVAVVLFAGTNAIADTPATPAGSGATPGAPSSPAPADQLSRVLGTISAVDTKAKTITLSGFGGGNDQTIAYDDNTKYMQDIPATVSDIKVGDTLRAFTFGGGDNSNASATSISPNILSIVPPVDINGPPFTAPFTPTEGVVATLSPLTITTPDKKTITVNIADDTRISKSKDATAADVKTNMFGSGIVKGTGASQVLTELHIIQIPDNNN